ncbi:subtilisin protease [Phakopsora pachyrhizi]|uniref:Subtilisin protease n=1 Tax=Phakopsora pachyrhizi TaxID=170000 RepID=A0AAV0AW49_PHAPC|nr:subtilisin protease [Phakopsora pachyrhizi]CAH7673513.1 subtilisin protease [Phakopsora pachyrhizi]CAH7673614.1 subtilisin protease [Phakopsora pachyrhizi]
MAIKFLNSLPIPGLIILLALTVLVQSATSRNLIQDRRNYFEDQVRLNLDLSPYKTSVSRRSIEFEPENIIFHKPSGDPPLLKGPCRNSSYLVSISKDLNVTEFVKNITSTFESESENKGERLKSKIGYLYTGDVFHGISACMSSKIYQEIIRNPNVVEIFPDTIMRILPIQDSIVETVETFNQPESKPVSSQGSKQSGDSFDEGYDVVVQKNTAPWNLQRISQRNKLNSNGNNPSLTNYSYTYQKPDGEDTFVYILDTGARETHQDFEGRVEMAAQFGGYELRDGNGHGTHCAGIVAGGRWGVAKQSRVKAIKVLSDDGDGMSSDIIAGIQYIVERYRASNNAPTVASLSLGGVKNSAMDRAVQSAINKGIHFVASAGNQDEDACLSSPASCQNAVVVAASDIQDNRASYSNWGTCVDLFAPGSNVTSAWFTSDRATARISGTSMAAPHVAGLIAYHLSQKNRTPKEMFDFLKSNANQNVIGMKQDTKAADSTPNFLT